MAGKHHTHFQAVRSIRLSEPELDGLGGALASVAPNGRTAAGCQGHTTTSVAFPANERTFDANALQYVRSILQYVRSIVCYGSPSRSQRAIAERKGHHVQVTEQGERKRRDRRRSQAGERAPGTGGERARDQRETRSWVPSRDVHAPDRSEGHDLGSHERADERDGRSLPRAPLERAARRIVTFAPGGSVDRWPIPRSLVRSSSRVTTFVVAPDNTPPTAPPREELTGVSQIVRAKRVERFLRATIRAAYAVYW